MLQIRNLNIVHKTDLREILTDFHLTLHEGDKAVIIGEEGNGKSTVLKWIKDRSLVEDYVEAHGLVDVGKHGLAYLPQELPREDREKTLYAFFSQEALFWDLTPREMGDLAHPFGVEVAFFYGDRKMGTLSGGENVKAQLMRILIAKPTVLLLDEPSNDLDIETLEWLEGFINTWKGIVLFVSHDETLIERTANMVVHLELIEKKTKSRYTVARVPYQQYVQERRRRIEKQERMAISDLREKRIRDEKFQRISQSVEYAQDTVSRGDPSTGRLLKKKMHAVKSMERRFEREDADMTEMPEEEEAIFFLLGGEENRVPNAKTVLDFEADLLETPPTNGEKRILARDVRLTVRGSEKICIIGKNGCGKTTLLKRIAEELDGKPGIHAELMPQNYEELLKLEDTPIEYLVKHGGKDERTKISTYLGALKFTYDEMNRPVAKLSGGQKAKIFLLKMSMSDANVLLLDEPTRNFSPLSAPVIRAALRSFPGAIISISHDRTYIAEVCDRVYELREEGLFEKWLK
ncbi:MAG: ATP-binding cassette domain-containing protein [Bacillota bacterium]|nr:ATP-binding cassette domain-containing protein [Bacillota bacterium]